MSINTSLKSSEEIIKACQQALDELALNLNHAIPESNFESKHKKTIEEGIDQALTRLDHLEMIVDQEDKA